MSTTGQEIDPNGVHHPKHYNMHPSGVECIEIIRHMRFNTGNAFKYLFRFTEKDGKKDLDKARWYMNDAIQHEAYDRMIPYYVRDLIRRVRDAETNPKLKKVWDAFDHYAGVPGMTALRYIERRMQELDAG